MSETLTSTGTVKPRSNSSAIEGNVVWAPAKSIWRRADRRLGRVLGATNPLAEVEPLYRRALAMDKKTLGPEHPTVTTDMGIGGFFGLE
jgi:hypothetical protein